MKVSVWNGTEAVEAHLLGVWEEMAYTAIVDIQVQTPVEYPGAGLYPGRETHPMMPEQETIPYSNEVTFPGFVLFPDGFERYSDTNVYPGTLIYPEEA